VAERGKVLELKKHVAAIHSSNKLSLIQRKIANALLFNAYDELLVKEEHEIHVRTLCNLIGYDSNDYKTIKKGLINLLATVIEWNLVDGDKLDSDGVWNASSIISDASIEGAVCTYSYSNKMKKLLYTPELYGRLNMVVQAKFQSNYGLALYENCIRYQNIEQTPWFDILQFRKLMGVEDDKYTIFRDFKRRVLDKAIEEVNKYSPLQVVAKLQKQKRQVVAIQFVIKHAKDQPQEIVKLREGIPLSQHLKEHFAFSTAQVEDTLSNFDEKYILEKISIVESSASFAQGKIKNVTKYLLKALEEDFQPTRSSKDLLQSDTMVSNRKEKQAVVRKFDDNKRAEYKRFQDKEIVAWFKLQSKANQKKISQEFEQYLGKSLYLDIYMRDGLANVLVLDQLCEFVRHTKREIIDAIQSFADFYAAPTVQTELTY
jgi:plasmid replication initiation protein